MKISEMKKVIAKIDECDDVADHINQSGFSTAIKQCLNGSLIERKNNLIQRLKAAGVDVEV